MLYSCTHMATADVKGLKHLISLICWSSCFQLSSQSSLINQLTNYYKHHSTETVLHDHLINTLGSRISTDFILDVCKFLTLNSSKTEFLIIGFSLKKLSRIDNFSLSATHSAHNLDFLSDEHLTFSDQISSLSKSILISMKTPLYPSLPWF